MWPSPNKANTLFLLSQPFRCTGRLREMTLPESEKREYGLFLICTPLETMHTSILEIRIGKSLFCTKNRMDLSFMDIDQKYDFFSLLGQDLRYPGPRGFLSPQRDERERSSERKPLVGGNANLTIMLQDQLASNQLQHTCQLATANQSML